VNIQIDLGQQARTEAEADKPCQGEGSRSAAMFDRLHELLFGRDHPALAWGIIAAALLYLAAHVIWAFARGWFPVRP